MPDYNFLSAPLWLITFLHVLTLTLHFAAMNILVGGIIIVLWGKINDHFNDPTVARMIRLFPTVMAATVTLGVAPLLFVQLLFHRQVYAASIVSGWYWLMIVAAVIISYYLLYASSFGERLTAGTRGWFLTLALVGLLYVSYVYSSVFSMAEQPEQIAVLYSQSQTGTVLNPGIAEYAIRWLHMILGAITVGGFFVGLLGRDNPPVYSVGKRFFLYGTIVNAVIGFVYLFTLGDYILPFMRSAGIRYLTAGIVMALGSVHFYFKKKFVLSGVMVMAALLTMVVSRHYVRLIKLGPTFEPSSMPVSPQWSVFGVFALFFVIAIGVIWYMLRLYLSDRKQPA